MKSHSTEATGQTPGTSEGDYIDKEEQLLRNMGQAPDKATEEEEDEPIASLSCSSSSQGIWPSSDAMARGYQHRTSTIGIPFFIHLSISMRDHMTYIYP